MLTSTLSYLALALGQGRPLEMSNGEITVRIDRLNGEYVETILAKDAKGKFREVLKSPTASGLPISEGSTTVTALSSSSSSSLFSSAPTCRFNKISSTGERNMTLENRSNGVTIKKTLTLPVHGNDLRVDFSVHFDDERPTIEYLFNSYAFAPDGKTMKQGGKPDSTFSPGLRKESDQVVGDHFFRSPAISAQKGSLAAVLIPDVESLKKDRVMPTVLDLDCQNGVVDAPLMSYGFCNYQLAGHVWYSHDRSMVRHVPQDLHLGMTLIVDAKTRPYSAHQLASDYSWKVGHEYFDKILPQAMPFEDYAKVCYPAVFDEHYGDNKVGWFDVTIDGKPCGGIVSGWGWEQGWVSWQCWFNNLRSAYGIRWWGKKLNKPDWVEKADKMLNMALAAPLDQGACPTTYQTREKRWKGCLITPTKDCYYDLTNMAWKGIWLLRFYDLPDCPRKEEVLNQCRQMAACMMRYQNSDGSFPTWLSKDLKVVPVLDHSAQSALPIWFITELIKRAPGNASPHIDSILKGADFLVKSVVNQQLYYDFETFFSCSPKVCKQSGATLDDPSMHDLHTLCPPQNTLSMQWTAEALRAVASHTGNDKYMPYALNALDMMCLYQNVWPISYRQTAYTYGGFGVQNSDGEYDDARQAQFGETLCDFGAQLGRRDYFERGVAATRAALTLINHPLHDEFGIYPNPNYPLGIEPENCGHGGDDTQAGRSGFDWGEGSGLTSMACLLDKYGEAYHHQAPPKQYSRADIQIDWSVLVDGGSKGIDMLRAKGPLMNPTFDFSDWAMQGWHIVGDFAEVPTNADRLEFNARGKNFVGTCENGHNGFRDEYRGVIESPRFQVTKPKIKLLVGGGNGKGVFVELIDTKTKEQLKVERGHNTEVMDERTWDVSGYRGRTLQIRIVDDETGGWGHINVGNIRCE